MKTVIHENERGLLFQNGRYRKLLSPGKYRTFGSRKNIEVVPTSQKLESEFCPLEVLLQDAQIAAQTVTAEAVNEEILLHFVNGQFQEILPAGKYAFWSGNDRHEFQKWKFLSQKYRRKCRDIFFPKSRRLILPA